MPGEVGHCHCEQLLLIPSLIRELANFRPSIRHEADVFRDEAGHHRVHDGRISLTRASSSTHRAPIREHRPLLFDRYTRALPVLCAAGGAIQMGEEQQSQTVNTSTPSRWSRAGGAVGSRWAMPSSAPRSATGSAALWPRSCSCRRRARGRPPTRWHCHVRARTAVSLSRGLVDLMRDGLACHLPYVSAIPAELCFGLSACAGVHDGRVPTVRASMQ